MIKIATIGISYLHKKNFIGLNSGKVTFVKGIDFLSPYRLFMRFKTLKYFLGSWMLRHIFINPFKTRNDLYHFFNTIAYTSTPWITTYELSLPRWGDDLKGIKLLADSSCKRIIAMSENARKIQLRILKEKFPQYHKIIESKLVVIHPYQEKNIKSWKDKQVSVQGMLKFGIVGNDFFRKGGLEVLETLVRFIQMGFNFELLIISNLSIGDYASHATVEHRKKVITTINQYPDFFKLVQDIPNSQVLELLKTCHVGLLPTYADTYGFSVLEFHSVGCPVITTDVSALSEINNNEIGWIFSVEKDQDREAYYNNHEQRIVLSNTIKDSLFLIFQQIFENPQIIKSKGEKALNSLSIRHCPEKNAEKYYQIYLEALK